MQMTGAVVTGAQTVSALMGELALDLGPLYFALARLISICKHIDTHTTLPARSTPLISVWMRSHGAKCVDLSQH